MTKPRHYPRGAIKSVAEVDALIQKVKATGNKVPTWHYDSADGTYMYRYITPESFVDYAGLHYFNRKGEECLTGNDFSHNNGHWYLFTNYWFVHAFALKEGKQLHEFGLDLGC